MWVIDTLIICANLIAGYTFYKAAEQQIDKGDDAEATKTALNILLLLTAANILAILF